MAFPWLGLGDGEGFEVSPMPPFDVLGPGVDYSGGDIRRAVVVDTETEGLDPHTCKAIEIGVRSFFYARSTGVVHGLCAGGSYDAFEDPGRPLTDEVKRLTGITDADVKGQRIDRDRVAELLSDASIVIAHNASFDRPFVDRLLAPRRLSLMWGCSLQQIAWEAHGLPGRKLAVLTVMHGFCARAHRAGSDAEATLHLLGTVNAQTRQTYLHELLEMSRQPWVRVVANGAPFDRKDLLKARGYEWSSSHRVWRRVMCADLADAEMAYLREHVYRSHVIPAITAPVPMADRFREEV